MTPLLKVAVAQLAPVFLDRGKTIEKACDAIREAARNGARLVAFPEAFLPGYPYFAMLLPPIGINEFVQRLHREAVEIPSPATDELRRAAREAGTFVVM